SPHSSPAPTPTLSSQWTHSPTSSSPGWPMTPRSERVPMLPVAHWTTRRTTFSGMETESIAAAAPRYRKPAEGSWTEHYPELGTGPVSYEDCTSPEFYERERDAIFRRAWLNVGRIEDLPRAGSYFTRELEVARTSIVVV